MASFSPSLQSPKGLKPSYWMTRGIGNAESYPPLRSTPTGVFDVVVIGAGITGLTAALHLKRAGLKVAVLEHHRVASGCTGNSTGHVSLHIDSLYSAIMKNFGASKATLVLRGQQEARDDIARNCAELGIAGFENVDTYIFAEKAINDQELKDEYVTLTRTGAHVEFMHYKANIGLPFATHTAFKILGAAQIDAYAYCLGLAKAVHGQGSAVFENTRVVHVKDGTPCEVQTEFTTLYGKEVIEATHTPIGVSLLQTGMIPQLSFVVAVHVEEILPAALYYDSEKPYHYIRRLDAAHPNVLIIGGADKKTGGSSATESECLASLRRYVSERFHVHQELASWSAQLFTSPDGLPYAGTNPGSQHVWVATGFGGDGLTLGTLCGKLVAQSIIGNSYHPLNSLYSSRRCKPLASAKQFMHEQLSVAKHVLLDRITAERSPLDELQPGEGKVVRLKGQSVVAAYREPTGRLHAHSAICPHLKCIVKWNDDEKTFDCPCHGSRFSVGGALLDGPALHDLEDLMSDAPLATVPRASEPQPSIQP